MSTLATILTKNTHVHTYNNIKNQQHANGRPRSEKEPTTSEQLALDAEMDGTAFGEVKAEEKRLKDERWAQYTDAHPRGAGNTMNRG